MGGGWVFGGAVNVNPGVEKISNFVEKRKNTSNTLNTLASPWLPLNQWSFFIQILGFSTCNSTTVVALVNTSTQWVVFYGKYTVLLDDSV